MANKRKISFHREPEWENLPKIIWRSYKRNNHKIYGVLTTGIKRKNGEILNYKNANKYLLLEKFDHLYSVLKLLTGLAIAALIAWKLTVSKAIIIAKNPATKKTSQPMLIL